MRCTTDALIAYVVIFDQITEISCLFNYTLESRLRL